MDGWGGARVGWVWGAHVGADPDGVEWLTVLGSAYERPDLVDQAADAVRPAALVGLDSAELARVVELAHPGVFSPRGKAYRVIERAAGQNSRHSQQRTERQGPATA